MLRLLCALALVAAASPRAHAIERSRDVEVLRGATWSFHTSGAEPCGVDRTNCSFAFPSSTLTMRELVAQSAVRTGDDDDVVVEPMPTVRKSPRAILRVSSERINHLDPLAVSFSLQNVAPRPGDWIGVYCNDNEQQPRPDSEYVDWRYTGGVDASTLQFGPLINMRCTWSWRYFADAGAGASGKTYVKLGTSPSVRMARGDKEPLQVHLASTTTPSEMRVMWVSAPVDVPVVVYGSDPTRLTKRALAVRDSYAASDMCHAPATTVASQYFRDPGTMHSAVMLNLAPEQTYYYKVGDAATALFSTVFAFQTPPAPGAAPRADKPMSFFVYGDLGDWNIKATGPKPEDRTATTIELMTRDLQDPARSYVAAMHNGDISYAMGRTYLWDQFGAMVQPVASARPYMVGIGNHEYCHTSGGDKDPSGAPGNGFHPPEGNYGADSYGECGVPTDKRFVMPANGNRMFWWSVEYGLTHHTQISSEHDFTPGAPMYAWLERDLASVDRTKTPWLFLYLHRPMYTSEQYDSDYRLSLFIRKHLEPLLARYRVDAVFSGHYHAYELTCPVFQEQCHSERLGSVSAPRTPSAGALGLVNAKAPVHIMVGSAGADVDNVGYFDVPWRVAAELNYGYGRVHVHNASHMEWEFVRNKARAVTSSTWIVSDHNWTLSA